MSGTSTQTPKTNRRLILLASLLLLVISAACSASNIVTKFFGSGGSVEDRIQDVEDELNPEGCFTRGEQFDEYWESRSKDLALEGKTCAAGDLAVYRNCLRGRVLQEGMCIDEAEMACSQENADLPVLFDGVNARIALDPTHSDAVDSMGFLEVSGWGFAEGVVMYDLKDAHLCTIGIEADLRGELDYETCAFSGEADLNFDYEGSACASVCGSGPDSDTPCPVTRSGESTWQATVTWDDAAKKWIIMGGAGCDDASSPGCVGFRGED